jgi:hypothetical protein
MQKGNKIFIKFLIVWMLKIKSRDETNQKGGGKQLKQASIILNG